MADTAVKSANVDVVGYRSPSSSAMSNEVILQISGDSGAVKQAVKAARDVGLTLLETMETDLRIKVMLTSFNEYYFKESNIHYISLSRHNR